jgi:hypothetical protein
MQRLRVISLLLGAALICMNPLQTNSESAQELSKQSHVDWVARALVRMESIKPGMTRATLLTVFTTEGGLSTGLRRTYVSQDCPYFKVDVEFEAVGRPDRDADGRVTLVEDDRDIIHRISRPYLQFSVYN